MRIYTQSSEETLRGRKLLKQWSGDGLLAREQHERLEQDTVSDLRTTNIFLRLVLCFFTVLGVVAAIALFFTIFLSRPSQQTTGMFLVLFAAACYLIAEVAAGQSHLYRFGMEEGLAVCSVALVCAGVELYFFSGLHTSREIQFVVPAVGAGASLWIWYRFNLWYAFPAAMIFAMRLPGYWTSSHSAQLVFTAVLYTVGVIFVARIRARHRFDYLEDAYSAAEAFLWLGIYLTLDLKTPALSLPTQWWTITKTATQYSGPFYWTTWVLMWCLPPLILARGIRQKDRLILTVGTITALITLITNKPYLGWQRHTWDPMLLGILLTGTALFLRRWLAQGPGGVRSGFTAARLSGNGERRMSLGSAVLGLVTPDAITPAPQSTNPDFHFGGGGSGGGGVSGDF